MIMGNTTMAHRYYQDVSLNKSYDIQAFVITKK